MKFIKCLLLLLIFIFFTHSISAPAIGTVVKINSSKDTFIQDANPNTNYGSASNMRLANDTGIISESLLMFDISTIPSNSVINSGDLYIYIYNDIGSALTAYVGKISESWTENGVTWNTKPVYDLSQSQIMYPDSVGWYSVGITSFVSDWYSGATTNNGLYINATPIQLTISKDFYTKENGNYIPYFSIDYSPPYTPPTPVIGNVITGNFYVNTAWSAGSGNKTDSYNISYGNGTWINGTTVTSLNTTLSVHGWQNLTIYAYNNSGAGTLSVTALTNSTQIPNNIPSIPPIITHANYNASGTTTVSWSASTDLDTGDTITYHYNIGTTSGGTDIFSDGTTTGTSSSSFSLTPNNTYYWKVKACDQYSCSSYSTESNFIYTVNVSVVKTLDNTKVAQICNVREGTPNTACPFSSSSIVVGNQTTTSTTRGLVLWNISSIELNHIVSTTTVTMYQLNSFTATDNIHEITSSWNSGTTWNTQPSVNSYETSLSVGLEWKSFNILNMFKNWYAGTNYGYEMRANDESRQSSDHNYLINDSYGGGGYKAYITVTLDNALPYATNFTIDHVSNNPHVTNLTPTFRWTPYDPEGDTIVSNNIQVWNGSGATGTQFLYYNSTNITSFVYNGTTLTLGSTYYVRIQLNDSLSSGLFYESSFVMNSPPTAPTSYTNFILKTNLTPAISWTKGTDANGDPVSTYVYLGENESNLTLDSVSSGSTTLLGVNKTLSESTSYTYRLQSYDGYEFSANTSLSNFTTGTTPVFSNETVPSTGTVNVAFNIDIDINVGTSNISTKTVTLTDPNSQNTYAMTLVSGNTYRKTYTPSVAGTYIINYYNASDEGGLSASLISTNTIVVSAASSTGGGGGGGGAPYSPSATPKTTSQIPVAPGIPIKLQNITSGRTQPESEAIANCLTESILFQNECSGYTYGIIVEPMNWWVFLSAYVGALFVVGLAMVITQQKRDWWQDILLYGTITVLGLGALAFLGFNVYWLNYVLDSSKYAYTSLSVFTWSLPIAITYDRYNYKNAKKPRMNSWIAKK